MISWWRVVIFFYICFVWLVVFWTDLPALLLLFGYRAYASCWGRCYFSSIKNLKPSNFPSQLCVHDMDTLSVLFGHYPPVTMRWLNANRRIPVATGVAFRWHCNQRIQPQHVRFFQGPCESIPGSCQIPKTCGHLDNVQVLSSLRQLDPLKFLQLVISRGIITFGHLQLACQGVWGVSSFWTTPSLWTNGDFDPCGGIHINQ